MVKLEDADFAVLGDSIDLNKVPALPLHHTVGYVKRATTILVQHLNRFARTADEKLRHMSASISRLETELSVLEAKLASIPGLDSIAGTSSTASSIPVRQDSAAAPTVSTSNEPPEHTQTTRVAVPQAVPNSVTSTSDNAHHQQEIPAEVQSADVVTVQKDPVYAKYFRMVQVGVPAQAVKLKMVSEGLNPALLDTPNAASPGGPTRPPESEEQSGSTSDED